MQELKNIYTICHKSLTSETDVSTEGVKLDMFVILVGSGLNTWFVRQSSYASPPQFHYDIAQLHFHKLFDNVSAQVEVVLM